MKDVIVNGLVSFISKYNSYDETKIEELKYGLISIYLLVTKLIIIVILSIILGILKEMIIFTIAYIPIRAVSFGLHATKSWICLISSTLIFVGLPFVAKSLVIPNYIISIIGSIIICLIFKNSPADTHKRPIINKHRRLFFKYSSTIIAIAYVFIALFIRDNFLSNCLIFALIVQSYLISPSVYKLFNLPYNNYKNYL